MIPFLVYGAFATAAALMASGCNQDPEKVSPSAPPGPSAPRKAPPKPRPDAAAKPVPSSLPEVPVQKVFLPITETLKGHPLAWEAYQDLKEKGVRPEQLDQGCQMRKGILGKDDGKVEACEIYEFVLERYEAYPKIAQNIAGRPLPWVLDDGDAKTEFDAEICQKVDRAIRAIQDSPSLKDLDEKSPEYQEKLAFALFYFSGFPKKAPKRGPEKTRWFELTRKLRFLGLHDFQEYLFQNGGLGTHDFARGTGRLYSRGALGALQDEKGADGAKSNVLYAVLARAGLKPFLTKIPYRYAHTQKDFTVSLGRGSKIYQSEYAGIGISLGETQQLFHPDEMIELSGLTQNTPVASLRHYLGNFLNDLGEDYFEYTQEKAKARSLNDRGMELDPENGDTYVFEDLFHRGRDCEAIFLRGLEQDPQNWFLHINYAIYLEEEAKDYEKSLSHYGEAFKINPDFFTADYLMAVQEVAGKVLKRHPRRVSARRFLRKIERVLNLRKIQRR